MAGIVSLSNISHRYGSRLALDSVTLSIEEGTLFALLGPNGSGKSTLFRILATLLYPTSGSANVCGADLLSDRDSVRRALGVVFQNPSLDDKLTVEENVWHHGHLYGLSGRSLRQLARDGLQQFGLADRSRDFVKTLSGGLKRRVELAKAMLPRPRVLLLDEPSTGLDPAARADLMERLQFLRNKDGVTTLLTTHLMEEADRCDTVAILDEGKLITHDTPTALKRMVGGDVLVLRSRKPLELAEKIKKQLNLDAKSNEATVRIEIENGHELVPKLIEAFPGEIESVSVGKPTLNDAFMHLTGHRFDGEKVAS